MEKFSQRVGIQQVNSVIQVNSIDVVLRKALWNVFIAHVRDMGEYKAYEFGEQIWMYCFYKEPFKLFRPLSSPYDDLYNAIKKHYFTLEWYEVYDFIEYVAIHLNRVTSNKFILACNAILKRELSAYRFVGKKLVPITSEQEITEVEGAMRATRDFTPHLDRALALLANRKSPDYANIIKESISAVEAICQLIAGYQKATLGEALRVLESKLGSIHPALRNALNSLYGYTSDAQGIHHAMLGKSNLDIEDARFMLITCSAFINYITAKADKAGIQLT